MGSWAKPQPSAVLTHLERFCVHGIWKQCYLIFTARRYASAVLAVIVCLSVRLSVTSRSCTKMAKPRITLRTAYDKPETLVFRCQKSWRNSNDITPNGGAKERWGRFLAALCGQYLAISQKRCQIGTQLLWKANRNSYVLYRMVLFSMTLGEPWPPQTTPFSTFCGAFRISVMGEDRHFKFGG